MPLTPTPQDSLTSRIAALERQVAELSRTTGRTGGTIRDPAGNVVITVATDVGAGLGRPYLPVGLIAYDSTKWASTTTGTATVLATATFIKQQPYIVVPVWTIGSVAGTTGTIQLEINGDPIGTPVALTDALVLTTLGPAQLPGAHLDSVVVNVLAARTAGSGTWSVQVDNAYSMAP